MGFNSKQLEAINAPTNQDVIISAVAGSGKTHTLTEKVYKVINQDKINPENILVLTFTDNAAFGMKTKIIDRFKADPLLQEKIASAHIQTFDSFNSYFVKKYANILHINANFTIIKNEILEAKKRELLDQILVDYYQNQKARILKTLVKFELQNDSHFKEIILDLFNKFNIMPYKQYHEYLANYDHIYDEKYFSNIYHDFIKRIREKLYNDLFVKFILEKNDDCYQKGNYDFINQLNLKLEKLNFNHYEFKDKKLNSDKKILNASDDTFFFQLSNLKAFKYDEYVNYLSEDEEYHKVYSLKEDTKLIIEITNKLIEKVNEYKNQVFAYEFTDLQKFTIRLLEENSFVRKALQNQFKFIMVDEYQDTNLIQEAFIDLLKTDNNSIFLVGDAKQAIYAFRNSDVKLFNKRAELLKKTGKKITMNYNYRSSMEVMNDINYIFKSYMTPNLGEINYLDQDEQLQYDKVEDIYGENPDFGIKRIVSKSKLNDDGLKPGKFEIYAILDDITTKVNSGFEIYDRSLRKRRKVTYSDFLILTRTTTHFQEFNDAFNFFKIPLNIKIRETFGNLDALVVIESLINILASLEGNMNIDTKLEYSSIARSYLYRISDQELFDAIKDDSYKQSVIYQDIIDFYNQNKDFSFNVFFFNMLNHFKIIEKLNAIGNVKNTIDKIESLYQLFLESSKNGFTINNLKELYKTFNKHEIEIKDESIVSLNDAVNLMTIHASKGLENKIVYMPVSMNNLMNTDRFRPNYIFTPYFGIVLPYNHLDLTKPTYVHTLYHDYYNMLYGNDELNEHARILYVALTRTENLLYFVGDYEAKNDNLYDMLNKSTHYILLDKEFVDYFIGEQVFKQEDYNDYLKIINHLRYLDLALSDSLLKSVYEKHLERMLNILNYKIAFCFIRPLAKHYHFKYLNDGLDYQDQIQLFSLVNYGCDYYDIDELNKHLKEVGMEEVDDDKVLKTYRDMKELIDKVCDLEKETKGNFDIIMKLDEYIYALNYIAYGLKEYRYLTYRTNSFKDELQVFDFDKFYNHSNHQLYNLIDTPYDYQFEFKEYTKARASKIEEDNEINQDILDLGVKLHRYLELTDLKTKDTSFIKDLEDKKLIDNVLANALFDDLENATIYKEYGYYDTLYNTTGFIDLFYIKNGIYYIVDYKTKHIDDLAYNNQLLTYKRNIEALFRDSKGKIKMYLLSIIDNQVREVE